VGTHIFLKARAEGAVKVIAPTKYANIVSPSPFALIVVGNISAAHTKDAVSIGWKHTMYAKINTKQAALPALLAV